MPCPNILLKNESKMVSEIINMYSGKPFDSAWTDLVIRKATIANSRLNGTLKDGFACGVIGHTINIDLQGNVFLCHACDIKLGSIYDPLYTLQQKSQSTAENIRLNFLEAKGCNTCEARDFCAGKCPLEPASPNQKKACEAVISLWRAVDKSLKKIKELENENH